MGGLTALKVKNAKPGRHIDGDVRGLHLVVTPKGSRSWVLRIVTGGKRKDIGLGGYPDVDLSEARRKAQTLRTVAKAGGDPIAERGKAKLVIPTFREAAEACHEARKAGWKDRTADAFLSTLKLHAFPTMGKLRVDSVDERDIVAALSPLWTAKPSAARKIRQRIGTVLDFSKGSGWRAFGAPRDGLRPLLSKQAKPGNFAAMAYDDVPAFVADLESKAETFGRLALLFAIFTAARSGEVRSMLWSHLDLAAKVWNRPAALMKSGKAHSVTLSDAALAVIERAKARRTVEKDCLVFPGGGNRPLSDMTLSKAMRDAGRSETVHGFRSSFRDWAAEKMHTIPDAVAEAALAHEVSDKVVAAYKRTAFIEMRRDLLNSWGAFLVPPEQGEE